MSHQVLAQKWRPQYFKDVVGQDHIVKALVHALDQNALHHAYLFSGIHGTGKTSLARIFAKCLNCEQGVTSKPCGQCQACQSIPEGRFVDLIEVDAASRTKVEDTRDLLANVHYFPTVGRFKVYLIDEVHMLSGHSFNALLKTLEEPPEHVKFLLATTDPQKLPATVLSRCLQFHLSALPTEKIREQLQQVLVNEGITAKGNALHLIARAARGSLRDALSLLEQGLMLSAGFHSTSGQSIGDLDEESVSRMLGSVDTRQLPRLLKAVIVGDKIALREEFERLSQICPDYEILLEDLIALLHQIAMYQVFALTSEDAIDNEAVISIGEMLTAERLQTFYQIALLGKRDLELSPDQRIAFEMILLRMLVFYPEIVEQKDLSQANLTVERPLLKNDSKFKSERVDLPIEDTLLESKLDPQKEAHGKISNNESLNQGSPNKGLSAEELKETPEDQTKETVTQREEVPIKEWSQIVSLLELSGIAKMIVEQCTVAKWEDDVIELILAPAQAPMLNKRQAAHIEKALTDYMGRSQQVNISVGSQKGLTPAKKVSYENQKKHDAFLSDIKSDENVKNIMDTFSATIDDVIVS